MAAGTASLALAAPANITRRKLKWFGINESGAEFGDGIFPGLYNKDYIWYSEDSIDTLIDQGLNMFRINFAMERLTPNSLNGTIDTNYMGNLTSNIEYITSKGAWAMIQPHNYGRFYGDIITDVAGFQQWWTKVAKPFAQNNLVVFDTNNEFHDMDQDLVVQLNQAAINGIRAAGAKTQYITPEGNSWTGAWTWVSSGNADTMGALVDPARNDTEKLIFHMHQYLDSDGSGTHEDCVSPTIFSERLQEATQWLRDNKKRGLIGEYAGGANDVCIQALEDGMKYLDDNNDVWDGAIWWAAGPWWPEDTIYDMEPPNGVAFTKVLPKLLPYA
ncbi:glycoside hydrolase family 5 protein [Aplosporella prunicola CBS 121167]|uniref:cellulase n=1 Tax=Aplosporella prunicola CBS 121167 TaxID=1176127 RepID=A0A6A6BIM7_9PEZI|nr:glycoside hydrolase family 5 protein [Aplosporella prunicola CBS 121167]KAF2142677.1 glycoside hydrolase family 5 protein [Aplosporella prunicola CBS 121167]